MVEFVVVMAEDGRRSQARVHPSQVATRLQPQADRWQPALQPRARAGASAAGPYDPSLVGEDGELDAIALVELGQQPPDVGLDRGFGHEQVGGDFGVRVAWVLSAEKRRSASAATTRARLRPFV